MDAKHSANLRTGPEWQTYRRAFEHFRDVARTVQNLTVTPDPHRETIDAAVLEMEKARGDYQASRDALLRDLVPPRRRSVRSWEDVKHVAELLWELEGRPQGTAVDDWRRAEQILRNASKPL